MQLESQHVQRPRGLGLCTNPEETRWRPKLGRGEREWRKKAGPGKMQGRESVGLGDCLGVWCDGEEWLRDDTTFWFEKGWGRRRFN